jgi:hypothetical protein
MKPFLFLISFTMCACSPEGSHTDSFSSASQNQGYVYKDQAKKNDKNQHFLNTSVPIFPKEKSPESEKEVESVPLNLPVWSISPKEKTLEAPNLPADGVKLEQAELPAPYLPVGQAIVTETIKIHVPPVETLEPPVEKVFEPEEIIVEKDEMKPLEPVKELPREERKPTAWDEWRTIDETIKEQEREKEHAP